MSRPPAAVPKTEARPAAAAKSAAASRVEPKLVPSPSPAPAPSGPNSDTISIPYASIIRCVPQELWGKLAPAGAGAAEFVLSREQVLEQLPQGTVKVSFSELRQHGPAGLFANNASQESRLVDMPLSDILGQLPPDSFARRSNQMRFEVSEEVPDLFGVRGERLGPVRVLDKQEAAASAAATRQNIPPARNVVPVAPQSFQTPPVSPPRPASMPAPAATPPAGQRHAPPPSSAPIKPSQALPAQSPSPARTAPAAAVPLSNPPPAKPLPKALPKATPAKSPAAPAPVLGQDAFPIPIDVVAATWPEEIRQELARMKTPGARIIVPAVEVCEGLKRRLVQFPWRTLRHWIQPQPASMGASPFDDVVLELPLNTITPLFLDHIRSTPAQDHVADYDTITEFFRRKEQAPPPGSIPRAPAVSNPAATATPPVPAHSFSPAPATGTLDLPIAQLSASWPDSVKHDIAQFNLAHAVIGIPLDYVDAGLRTGKVEFTWRQVCAWLKPASPAAQLSINGELRVPFPLNFVAPLFIKATAGAQAKRKTHVDQEIPDLFSAGGLMPTPAGSAGPEPAVEPAASAPVSAVPKAPARSLAELFNDPDKRSWTPNDIVHRTAQLPGVAGALIALQDGLLVAACMPPATRTEMIAAFVPQIFGRMSQYTRELQLGDTRGIAFTVESGTLHVFNAGIIYFAALGKPGDQLPIPELQLIATELSRHTK